MDRSKNNNTFIGGDSEANVTTISINIEAGALDNIFLNFVLGDGTFVNAGTGTRIFDNGGLRVGNVSKSGATVFDWYEEGAFTPTLTFATPGDLSVSYAANGQIGSYTRSGNRVTCNIFIQTSAFTYTTATGALRIQGLPYLARNTVNAFSLGSCVYQGITDAARPQICVRVDPGLNFLSLVSSGPGVPIAFASVANVATGSSIILIVTITYEVPT